MSLLAYNINNIHKKDLKLTIKVVDVIINIPLPVRNSRQRVRLTRM